MCQRAEGWLSNYIIFWFKIRLVGVYIKKKVNGGEREKIKVERLLDQGVCAEYEYKRSVGKSLLLQDVKRIDLKGA